MQPAIQPTLYESLEALPEGVTGEILNGQLHTQSRPAGPHAVSGSVLGARLLNPFQIGDGGPGGWWIIYEPEIHFVHNAEVVVPDWASWRRERMPYPPEDQRFVRWFPIGYAKSCLRPPSAKTVRSSCRCTPITECGTPS